MCLVSFWVKMTQNQQNPGARKTLPLNKKHLFFSKITFFLVGMKKKTFFLLEMIDKDSPNAKPMEISKDTMTALCGLYKSSCVEFKWYINALKSSPTIAIDIIDIKIAKEFFGATTNPQKAKISHTQTKTIFVNRKSLYRVFFSSKFVDSLKKVFTLQIPEIA